MADNIFILDLYLFYRLFSFDCINILIITSFANMSQPHFLCYLFILFYYFEISLFNLKILIEPN